LFITIRGVCSGGKQQAWEVVAVTEKCSDGLRARFAGA
jgi:hypothetical protein